MVGAPTHNRSPTRAAKAHRGTSHDHLYDTDPNTQTIAAAWASSQLGQPEREVGYGFATTGPTESVTASEEEPTARRVMVAGGLACGVAAGAMLGVMLFTYTDSSQPTVVAPGPAPQHAVVIGPSTAASAPKPVVPKQSTAPTVVVPAPRVAPTTADVATPPLPRRATPPLSSTSRFRTIRRCLRSQGNTTQNRPSPRIRTPNRRNRRSPMIRISNNRTPETADVRPGPPADSEAARRHRPGGWSITTRRRETPSDAATHAHHREDVYAAAQSARAGGRAAAHVAAGVRATATRDHTAGTAAATTATATGVAGLVAAVAPMAAAGAAGRRLCAAFGH